MQELTQEEIITRRWEAIESIQLAIANSGGRFFTRKSIESMTIGESLNIGIPNLIKIQAVYDTDKYIELQKNILNYKINKL
jgi:hypothetical protein